MINYSYKYQNAKGKWVFAPTPDSRQLGRYVKRLVGYGVEFPSCFYHLKKGGHIAALHALRRRKYFARLDLQDFFYSVGRNRVTRLLRSLNRRDAERLAKASTVKNPLGDPSYSLPYGFVQSPILASFALQESSLGKALLDASADVEVSVFVDDIAFAADDLSAVSDCYARLRDAAVESNFTINERKSNTPAPLIEVFHCHLSHMRTIVTEERRMEFAERGTSPASQAAFDLYCQNVEGFSAGPPPAGAEDTAL